ncbi:MAG: hypothetical protein O2917_01980 [Acidobacteria bacterium]|nr:hypothetical protein [Acidobacteriota bacterium]
MIGAFLEGCRRALAAPALTFGTTAAIMLVTIPLGLALGATGWWWDHQWISTIGVRAHGYVHVATHEVLGLGGTVFTWRDLIGTIATSPLLMTMVVASGVVWTFLTGGILDRLARARPVRTAGFFAACGVHFFRFLRLGLLLAPVYWAVCTWLQPLLHPAAFLLVLAVVNVIGDYARVRTVVEDRWSVLASTGAAIRFVRRRVLRVLGLSLLSALPAVALVALWYLAEPSAAWSPWLAVPALFVYVLARVWIRLVWMAGAVAFFQRELAHAEYTAAPLPVWPDSPAAEALSNLTSHTHH